MFLLILTVPLTVIIDIAFQRRSLMQLPFFLTVTLFSYTCLLYCVPPDPAHVGKGLTLASLLYAASYSDAKTHEIPDWIPILILFDGLILLNFREAVTGFFIISIPFYLMALFTHGGIGGGDIKLMAAAGWALGAVGAIVGTVIGSTLLVLLYLFVYRRRNPRHKRYALAPYLSIGCFFAYLLTS